MNEEVPGNLAEVQLKLAGWWDQVVVMLPNIVLAVVIVVVGWLLGRLFASATRKGMVRVGRSVQISGLAGKTVKLGVFVGGVAIALGVLQLDKTVASLLAGIGILGLALGFAMQDVVANFVSGILLAVRQPFRVGEVVEMGEFMGTIEAMDLWSTQGRTFAGQRVLMPNKSVLNHNIVNYATGEWRIDVSCGVSYADDLEAAQRVAREAAETIEGRLTERPVEVFYTGFGDSSIDFVVRTWIDSEKDSFLDVRSEVVKRVKAAFDREEITIPFPIRTLDVDIAGGGSLSEAVSRWRPES